MIVDERIASFIESLDPGNTPFLNELERKSIETYVPIIRPATQNLIKFLLELKRPVNILEVGTAIGFSSILMAEYSDKNSHITTIEKYEKRIPIAKDNIKASGYSDKITLIEGDATDVLHELAENGNKYDMIFMDAAKGQYINFLPDVLKLLSPCGMLVSDNVLQDGDLIESRFAVIRRNRTIHSRMREYLYTLTHCDELVTTILPIADGMTLSVKK